jgi:RNA polymerase sigma-70 factor (ECF subfamily)
MTFREIYDAHFRFVWRSLRRLGVAEADLPDTTQEVFLVVHRRLADFEGRAKITTWLYRICFRVANDRRRRAHVRRELPHDGTWDSLEDPRCGPDAHAARGDDVALLEAGLREMDLDQRAVFTLFELEEMTGQEIADALEIPLGTVYSRLRLARAAFHRGVKRQAARSRTRIAAEGGGS